MSNIWNDCPVCGIKIKIFDNLNVGCSRNIHHYYILLNRKKQIMWEKTYLLNNVYMNRYSHLMDNEGHIRSRIFYLKGLEYKDLFVTDKTLSIEQAKRLLPLL